jgi:nucleotidyltransferase substrate binding protein (TIGR01987 family)
MTDSNVDPHLPELDIKPFERTLGQFEIALAALDADPQNALIRDALIQRFEFTYELSIKMLRRYLRLVAISEDEVNELTFRDLIRRASDLNLIKADLGNWVAFPQARNDTVHTYNEIRAIEVAGATRKFALEARALLEALKEKVQP